MFASSPAIELTIGRDCSNALLLRSVQIEEAGGRGKLLPFSLDFDCAVFVQQTGDNEREWRVKGQALEGGFVK